MIVQGRAEGSGDPPGHAQTGKFIEDADKYPAPANPDGFAKGLFGIGGKLQRGDQRDNVELIVGKGEIFRGSQVKIRLGAQFPAGLFQHGG